MKRPILSLFTLAVLCFTLQACDYDRHPKRHDIATSQQAEINQKLSDLFLARNKTQLGVVTLDDGLQYKIIDPGLGIKPSINDLVRVTYKGQFMDGTVFDQTHTVKPIVLRVSSVIPGWQEALVMMLPGSVWVLYIPPHLAYRERGIPGLIGPNQTLIYTVHLIEKVTSQNPTAHNHNVINKS